jgi:hypothetical protein
MTDVETLAERVDTVERAITDGDHGFPAVDDLAALTERIERLEQRVDELDERAEELAAATQAIRGYVGNIRSVNNRVEERADAALSTTERLERRLDAAAEERTEPWDDAEGQGSDRIEGVEQRPAAVDGESAIQSDSEVASSSANSTRDPGVLERMRSLL